MPSAIPAAMLTELQGLARIHFTVDISLANTAGGTTTYRFAEKPTASESAGMYLPYVTQIGTLQRSTGFPTFGFQNPRTAVSIFDKDRDLQKAIGGPAAGKVIGASANIVMRSFNVAAASHYTVLPGKIKDFSPSGEYEWDFVIGPDIDALESKLKIPRPEELWEPTTIPQANRAEPGRLIWGEWVSAGRSDEGLIPIFLVDSTLKDWYICHGHLPDGSVTNVFVDGANDTADWSLTKLLQNGNPVSVMRYSGGSTYTASNEVQVDMTGLGDVGDASAGDDVVRGPSEALRLTLTNFVFNAWPQGASFSASEEGWTWITTAAELEDTTSFPNAATYHTLLNHEIAAIWTSDDTGLDILKQYMETFYLPVFFSDEFTLKIGLIEFYKRDIYPSGFVRKDQHQIGRISGKSFGEDRISRINVSYLRDAATERFDRRFTAANDDLGFDREEDLDFTIGGPSVRSI